MKGSPAAGSLDPNVGIKPDPTASTDVDMEERRVWEAPYPCEKPGTFHEEALDVGAVDVGDPNVNRPSLPMHVGGLRTSRTDPARS